MQQQDFSHQNNNLSREPGLDRIAAGVPSFELFQQERVEEVRVLALSLLLAEQQERSRVSRLLYDDLQQLLFGLLMRLELTKAELEPHCLEAGLVEHFDETLQQTTRAIDIVQSLVVELGPPVLKPEDLEEALRWLITHMEKAYQLDIQLSIQEGYRFRDKNIQTLALHLIHQLLLELVKHRGLGQAYLELSQEGKVMTIQIRDKKSNSSLEQLQAGTKARKDISFHQSRGWLELIGGQLEINSTQGGFDIIITVPVE